MKELSPEGNPIARSTFIDSSSLLHDEDFEGLRRRADVEGYLFFKKLLPAGELLGIRAEMLAILDKHGWRQAGHDVLGGFIDEEVINRVPESEMTRGNGVNISTYDDTQKLESFHRLPHHPKLIALYRGLFEREVFVHPRHIARMITAHFTMTPTPQHQDFPHIQGTANTWTCWFPLGDCPRSHGGLIVLRGSHREGYIPVRRAKGAGEIAVQLCPGKEVEEWLEVDYELGDVVTFPSYTVHKALPSQFKDQIRLSMDVRYQAIDGPIEEKSLHPHCDLTWEEIYANWESDDLKYYWRQLSPKRSPWNDSFIQPSRRIC